MRLKLKKKKQRNGTANLMKASALEATKKLLQRKLNNGTITDPEFDLLERIQDGLNDEFSDEKIKEALAQQRLIDQLNQTHERLYGTK